MYLQRLIETEIKRVLASSGALLVCGPRFCGKTTTGSLFQKSILKLNNKQSIELAKLDPNGALVGEKPRMIDEWQKAPEIWDCIKAELDENYQFGKYILTGSSTPVDKTQIHHSGTGRITPLVMRPMSLAESGDSAAGVSLLGLFSGDKPATQMNSPTSLEKVAFFVCRGGWPISVRADHDIALEVTRNYYNSLFVFEDSDNEQFRNKKPELMKALLRSYARNVSSEASAKTIMEDVRQGQERTFDRKTYDAYHEALCDLFIIEDMPAWSPAIRSKTSIRTTPTRHFVDTSIGVRSLGLSPADLMADLNSFGLFFEDLAVRDLRVYAQNVLGTVSHYRDNTGLECDAVIHLEDGRWGAIEIKLGGEKLIEEGASSLLRLQNKIKEKSAVRAPSFLLVLCAVGPTYTRKDGVIVAPLTNLGA